MPIGRNGWTPKHGERVLVEYRGNLSHPNDVTSVEGIYHSPSGSNHQRGGLHRVINSNGNIIEYFGERISPIDETHETEGESTWKKLKSINQEQSNQISKLLQVTKSLLGLMGVKANIDPVQDAVRKHQSKQKKKKKEQKEKSQAQARKLVRKMRKKKD